MEKLVSNWYSTVESLPENYVLPPEQRPGKLIVALCKTIPVIDLGKVVANERRDIIQQILKASQEFGFFQVINHGVSENVMEDTRSLFKEFFNLADEDKASVYSEDSNKSCRLYTSGFNHAKQKVQYWRDIYGLQVFKDGQWIGIEPLPNAFVVNIGHQLQIISNGILKSAEHRAVTNSKEARTSIATLINPSLDSVIELAEDLVSECNPPLYRAFHYKEFLSTYIACSGDTETVLEAYKLHV